MSRIGRQFEPGDYVAWYMGPVQYRGHILRVFDRGRELLVTSTSGVKWHLVPDHQQVDLLGPLPTDPIGIER